MLRHLPEDTIPAIAYSQPHSNPNGFRINNIHLRGLGSSGAQIPNHSPEQIQGTPPNSIYCSQQNQQRQTNINTSIPYSVDNHSMLHTTLPDSPPDSEPYSPPDGHPNAHTNGHTNHHGNGHSNPRNHVNTHQNTQQDNTKFTSTPSSMHSHMYPAHHRPPGMTQPQKSLVTMTGYHEPQLLNHLTPTTHQPPQLPPVTMPLNIPPQTGMNPQILTSGNLSPQSKKRKHVTDSPGGPAIYNRNGLIPTIKQEPSNDMMRSYTNSSYLPECDEDGYSNYDPDSSNGYDGGVYQVIKWSRYDESKWSTLTDANLKDLPAPQYRVDADKGFNFSVSDDSFVCQKKNHFQITCHVGVTGDPKYVRTTEGVKKIDHYCLHFNGIKLESPSQTIKVEQSQSDRSKKPFKPVRMDLLPDQVAKLTVGRLHFSETTSNNMRKKGRPNPDQRYFQLVVALHAHSGESSYMIAASVSAKIIVRASNPGQFDSDMEATHWTKGATPDSVYHIGRVGVNTDHPDEALTVHGNIKLSGQILQTSDRRAKTELEEVDSKEQLKKVSGIKIYNYQYSEDYAEHVGIPEDKRKDTGVIAQEVQEVLPDAVISTGDVKFENGNEIKDLLVVNKDRIFMENVGAVKELCKLTDNLEVRIDELEKMNTKLSKLKRYDSMKSTMSSKSTCSNSTINSHVPSKKPHRSSRPKSTPPTSPAPAPNTSWCSNRFIQITIIVLICIMAICLILISVLYILEQQKNSPGNSYHTTNHYHATDGTNKTGQDNPTHRPNPTSHSTTRIIPADATTTVATTTAAEVTIMGARCSGPPDCEEQCCGNVASDQPAVDVTGYEAFLKDIAERKHPQLTPSPHVNIVTYHVQQEGPTTPSGSKIQLLVPPKSTLYNDNAAVKLLDDGGKYKRRRRRRRDTQTDENDQFKVDITVPDLNFTLTHNFFDEEFSMQNNYTYNIEYSKYLDTSLYTLKFGVSENQKVHLCHRGMSRICGNNVNEFWPTVDTQWEIAFGRYRSSFYRFRVANAGNEDVCDQPGEDAAGNFVEYNLFFARAC
ncbi:hypothetical protein ACF0H5_015509 [Mactra antiquata]